MYQYDKNAMEYRLGPSVASVCLQSYETRATALVGMAMGGKMMGKRKVSAKQARRETQY